jgi:hypothetical protein
MIDRHTIELAPPEHEGRYLVRCYSTVIGQYLWSGTHYTCWYAVDGVMYKLGTRPDARATFEAILDSHDCDIDEMLG